MIRSASQNDLFHARMRTWARNIVLWQDDGVLRRNTDKRAKVQESSLKDLGKAMAFLTGEPRFSKIMGKGKGCGTSGLSRSDFSDFFNLVEQKFSQLWPDAYEPIPRDQTWDAEN